VVISVDTARVDNAIHLDYLTSEVASEESEIHSTDPNILRENNFLDDKLHFGMPGGSGNCEDEGHECAERNAISTTSWRRQPATEPERFDLGTSDVEGYEGDDGDAVAAHADEEEEAL
jgi:hypothetical protein